MKQSPSRRWLGVGTAASALLFSVWIGSAGCRRTPPIRNVLLISIDTLRADHVGAYGFARKATPNLDALARQGVVFKNVYSPIPQTLPAHASMMTGMLPPSHGVRDNLHQGVPDSSVTLAEVLKEKGLVTGAVVSSLVLDRRFNLNQGFDSYDDRFQVVHKIGDVTERKGDETARVANAWLDAHAKDPFFLFVHFYDPHDGYEPPEPYATQWKDDPYSGEVAFADHCAGQVLDKLQALGVDGSTLVIVASDHGEMLGEHGEANHGFFLYEGALRVPLIVKAPGAVPAQVDEAASLVDVMPTVVSLAGGKPRVEIHGKDLSLLVRGSSGPKASRPLYAESFTAARYYGAAPLLAVLADGWKYIEAPRPELYDLRADAAESRNLVQSEPAKAERLIKELQGILISSTAQGARTAAGAAVDQETRQRLESLGYLSRGSGSGGSEIAFDRSREDPKDLIAFFRKDRDLSDFVERKRYDEARALCAVMLKERPGFSDCHLQMSKVAVAQGDMKAALAAARKAVELSPTKVDARLQLGVLQGENKDRKGAIEQYRKAVELQPESPEARALLGRALADEGRLDEAATALGAAMKGRIESPEAAIQFGYVLARQGKLDDAIAAYRSALEVDPSSAQAHAYLGSALAKKGRMDEAKAAFEAALAAKPDDAELHDWLGVALRDTGDLEGAVAQFQEAIRLAPNTATAHYNLARALKQQGKIGEAIERYKRALAIDPHLPGAHNSLGSVLGVQGRMDEAIAHFREALRDAPNDPETVSNLGLALRSVGKNEEALRHFEKALRLRPDWPVPMNETAWIRATHPDPRVRNAAEAVRLAARAVALTSRSEPVMLDTLGAAYAAAGEFESAAAAAKEGASLAAAKGASALSQEIAKRAELYRRRVAFREAAR